MIGAGGDDERFSGRLGIEEAVDAIRRLSPSLFEALSAALRGVAEAETMGMVRAGGGDVLVAQGRARMAHDILSRVQNHQQRLEAADKAAKAKQRISK